MKHETWLGKLFTWITCLVDIYNRSKTQTQQSGYMLMQSISSQSKQIGHFVQLKILY